MLKNQNVGRSWNFALADEDRSTDGFWLKTAYSYGEAEEHRRSRARSRSAPGTTTSTPGDPNNPRLGFRAWVAGPPLLRCPASYTKEFFSFGGTTFSVFWESRTIGNASYTFAGDLNGDGGTATT